MQAPMISVTSLENDLDRMRFSGFWPAKVECGPMVFEMLVNFGIYQNQFVVFGEDAEERRLIHEERIRKEYIQGLTAMTFNGMPVQLCDDVPDGQLWPSREKGGSVAVPFAGTEAKLGHGEVSQ